MKYHWLVLSCSTLALACHREDAAAPTWEVVLNGAEVGGVMELTGGDVLTFTGDAQDDVDLGQAVFSLSEWTDGFQWRVGEWEWVEEVELEGTHSLVGKQWVIPDSVDGAFALDVVLSDALGQTAPEVHYTLHLVNPDLQRIQLDSIAGYATTELTGEQSFPAGVSLDLVGSVISPIGLIDVKVSLESDGTVLEDWTWGNPSGTTCDLSAVPFSLPSNPTTAGSALRLKVRSVDANGTVANAYLTLKISA